MNQDRLHDSLYPTDAVHIRKNPALRGAAALVVADLRDALESRVEELLMGTYAGVDSNNVYAADILQRDVLLLVVEFLSQSEVMGEEIEAWVPPVHRLTTDASDHYLSRLAAQAKPKCQFSPAQKVAVRAIMESKKESA